MFYISYQFVSKLSTIIVFFCPTKTQVFIHRTHSLLVPFGWHRQNWHRSSRYSPELVFWCQKHRVRWFRNPTSHGESTILCLGQVKKSEHLVEMEGIFQPSKKHVIWTPLLPGKTWHETFPSPGWWIPTNRKSGWFQIHPRKSTWNLKMKVRKMIFFFKQVIFRFHVHFPGCMFYFNIPKLGEDEPILTNSFQMGWFIQPPTRFKFS